MKPIGGEPRRGRVIRDTPQITNQILTKRAGRILPNLPTDWADGYQNVWLGVSVEAMDQIGRISVLRQIPAKVRFVSFEPLLADVGPFDTWAGFSGRSWAAKGAPTTG